MKKLFLTSIAILIFVTPVSVLADCTVYEYAALKDMNQEELQAAYTAVTEAGLSAIKWQTKFIQTGDKISEKKEAQQAKICDEQEAQIKRVWVKKFPNAKLE
ncbi:MAG: hypothetical protein A2X82_13045 [Geobacteraceae bacterium GWC2_55_20]|nr:MAG: hypothetical protein A2X82_13045 [Geobacteraceae bacterium GWC2_55_20]OGU21704.1 MAG: hypothetical protein A2X85_07825 [Geobacteraceae bacterium GWF2_54_21]HCE66772.1 hypothetical protein [Geobacter sp.]